ncbi:MAG: hypothetical protein H6719_20685 [Sandaracinaceae bacterium]|nr:hypothetical protein [Sandaracinaceae bacterium]
MAAASFDPSGFFEFDLATGSVHARGTGRVLILSDSVVAPLVSAAVGNGDLTSVRKLGRELGDCVVEQLGGGVLDAPVETVLEAAAGVLSLMGWGRLQIDRWGEALVASLEQIPHLDDDHLGVAALLGGLMSRLADREIACVPVSAEGHFLLVEPSVAQKVWKWSRSGDDIAAIVGRLAPPTEAS